MAVAARDAVCFSVLPKYLLPLALLISALTLIVCGGMSLLAPDANLPWNPSNVRTYSTVLLLLVGVSLGMLGVAVLSSRQRLI